eukprot:g47138.t1
MWKRAILFPIRAARGDHVTLPAWPEATTQEGLRAFCFFLEQRPEPSPRTTALLRLAKLILTLNNFSFNSSHFLQVRGVAMGTRMGPYDMIPLVLTYHPTSIHIQKIIRHHFRHL